MKVGLKEPLCWQNCLCKSLKPCPLESSPNFFRDTFNCVKCGQKILGLSLVGVTIPSLIGNEDEWKRTGVCRGKDGQKARQFTLDYRWILWIVNRVIWSSREGREILWHNIKKWKIFLWQPCSSHRPKGNVSKQTNKQKRLRQTEYSPLS